MNGKQKKIEAIKQLLKKGIEPDLNKVSVEDLIILAELYMGAEKGIKNKNFQLEIEKLNKKYGYSFPVI